MSNVQVYDFHQIVGFRLDSSDADAQLFFNQEFAQHRSDQLANLPSVQLRWELSSIPTRPSTRSTFHMHKLLARWFYRITLGEDRIELFARGNRMALPMVHHMLVHPGLRYLASQHGILLLHGAAVVYNGRSLVLTGAGGAGKTTSSSILLDAGGPGWQLHADDYVFLHPGGMSYGYLTRSHLYRSLLQWVDPIRDRLTRREKLKLSVYGAIRQWSGNRLKWPVRLGPDRMWPDRSYAPQARVGGVLILEKGLTDQIKIEPFETHQIPIEDLLVMNFYEARHFIRLVNKASRPISDDWLESWRARERTLLERMTHTIPFYRLILPATPTGVSHIRSELTRAVVSILEDA